jgi:hypothetical protein
MVLNMIGKCSECGKRRKLYHAVGSTVNALWCANCIAKHKNAITQVYEPEPHASPKDDLITKIAKIYGVSKEYVANNIGEFIKEQ